MYTFDFCGHLCHRNYAIEIVRKIKITNSLTLNEHSSLTGLSILNTNVHTSKSKMINKQYQNQPLWVLNLGPKGIVLILVLGAIQTKPSVQYKDNYACF